MIKMLYHQNSYQKEYRSKVIQIEGKKVLLDETIFFPVTPTEPGDIGIINNYRVVEVKRDPKKDIIWHFLENSPDFKKGDVAHLQIDWERRYKMMRLHSALHLLAGCFDSLFRQRAVAGIVESDTANLVFKQPVDDYIGDSIAQANDDIQRGLEIVTYEDEKRKGFRWCKIGDYPPIPCGGVHVRNAKEIKKLLLKEKRSEGQRLIIGVE
jgi:alanyl-tRNA synthetase